MLFCGEKFVDMCICCCSNLREKIKKYKNKNKKVKVKPILYDNDHIIVINPYGDKHQIATVAKVEMMR